MHRGGIRGMGNGRGQRARTTTIWTMLALLLAVGLAVVPPAGRVAAVPPPATFAAAVTYPTGDFAYTVAIGDLNGDGKLDFAVANANIGYMSVLFGNGNGTFQAAVNYTTDGFPAGVAMGDLNGDGKLDIVAVGSSGTANVFINNGNGTFPAAVVYSAAPNNSTASAVALGDLNGDNKLDIVTSNQGGASASVLLGNGDGTFGTRVDYPTGANTGPI